MVQHIDIRLPAFSRGFHIITEIIQDELPQLPKEGLFHLFIHHTSAGLTINENADPSVRVDFESIFNELIKENQPYYTHTFEGADDMPAHVKASLVGSHISVPIRNGKINLGTWQGIYLCEFRNNASGRKLTATIYS
jgi:secondary thiamine-phosphate synthase enzyme